MNCLRKRCDTMSMTLTATMMMIRMAQVWASWNPRIASHKVTPMPPAPTMPTTVADRTFDSKRYSEYEIDRKSVVEGKSVSVRVDLGGRRIIKKKKKDKRNKK